MKGFEVHICDIKRTYQAFSKNATFRYTVQGIIDELKAITEKIELRSEKMDAILEVDPTAIATCHGFSAVLVVVEEYLALMNAATPAEKKVIESLVKRITTTGRQLGMYLIITMQVSGADTIDTSIRSNLGVKLVYGNASETIYRTAFGQQDVPHIAFDLERGEGLGMIGSQRFLFRTPMIKYKASDVAAKLSGGELVEL